MALPTRDGAGVKGMVREELAEMRETEGEKVGFWSCPTQTKTPAALSNSLTSGESGFIRAGVQAPPTKRVYARSPSSESFPSAILGLSGVSGTLTHTDAPGWRIQQVSALSNEKRQFDVPVGTNGMVPPTNVDERPGVIPQWYKALFLSSSETHIMIDQDLLEYTSQSQEESEASRKPGARNSRRSKVIATFTFLGPPYIPFDI
ncbi:hypothetical protein BKA70DRAFT_1215901 [Coprinopsis sp. MPI-PUGE-AT-0042]|nr:hypothetical protein BKA70DRAFT_1215901 [Coprinopsis sp. MPI-PUGE-AT-0042]